VKHLLKGYDLNQKSLGRIPLRVVALLASTAATSLSLLALHLPSSRQLVWRELLLELMLLVLPLFFSATMTFVNGIFGQNGIWREEKTVFSLFFRLYTRLWHLVCKALEIPRWEPQKKPRLKPEKRY